MALEGLTTTRTEARPRAGEALADLTITASEAVHLVFEYVAINKRLPVQVALQADEDADILEVARQRLADLTRV